MLEHLALKEGRWEDREISRDALVKREVPPPQTVEMYPPVGPRNMDT
jgi:hypothetical protein